MPLDLHEKCLAQLRASLAERLSHVRVTHGGAFLEFFSLQFKETEAILPQTGKVRERLMALLGDMTLSDFVIGTLSRELYETQEYVADRSDVALSSIREFADLDAVANRLVSSFISLPWRYALTCPLPVSFSEIFCPEIGRFSLSDEVIIRNGDDALQTEFPLVSGIPKRDRALGGKSLLSSLAALLPPTWNSARAYFQIKADGFIGNYAETSETFAEAVGALRSFYGLAIALRLLKINRPLYAMVFPLREGIYIHREIEKGWIVEGGQELSPRLADTICDLVLDDVDGALTTTEAKLGYIRTRLAQISVVFKAGERAKNIRLAAQWLFDSYSGTDELLQFVQTAVVVEILLGDKASSDLTGLGELLANRCAYLIATTHSQRTEILADFRLIYGVRSRIVHRGKSRLARGERELFEKLRWMCRRIIHEEIILLEKDLTR